MTDRLVLRIDQEVPRYGMTAIVITRRHNSTPDHDAFPVLRAGTMEMKSLGL